MLVLKLRFGSITIPIQNFNLNPENMDLNQFKFFIKRPVHGPKKTDKTGFHRSSPVFLSSKIKVDRSRSRSFNFGPKDRTGPDLQTLDETDSNNIVITSPSISATRPPIISDFDRISVLLNGLPPSYQPVIVNITGIPLASLTFEIERPQKDRS